MAELLERREISRPDRVLLDVANRRALSADIVEAITSVEVTRTMEGAATLTIAVRDDEGDLAGSDLLIRGAIRAPGEGDPDARTLRPIDLRVVDEWFRLVKAARAGPTTTLTFEDRVVAYLRVHDTPKSVSRASQTRAMFIRGLVEEIGKVRRVDGERVSSREINFWAPHLRKPIPVLPQAKASPRASVSSRSEGRSAPSGAAAARSARGLTVKGARASTEQRRNMVTVLGIADNVNAGAKATKALVEACIVESTFRNLSFGDRDSQGILQLRIGLHGATNARSVTKSARLFLTRGFTGRGGAIKVARSNPGFTAGQVAQAVQGSAFPGRYDQVGREADKIITALGGSSGGGGSGGGDDDRSEPGSYVKQYRFERKKGENSWTAIRRLADEVNRRAFVVDNTVWYARDSTLLLLPAVARLSPDHPAVLDIDWDLDAGKTVREATVRLNALNLEEIALRPGEPVSLTRCGPAAGKWLIWSMSETSGSDEIELTLRQAENPKYEPRSETVSRPQEAPSRSDPNDSAQDGRAPINRHGGAKGIVEDAVRVARQAGGSGVYVASAYRPGDPKDHGSNNGQKAARDIAVRGIDALGGPPSPKLDRGVVAIGKAFGRNYGSGRSGPFQNADNIQWKGYRVQIIWRTPRWGGHMGHIHIGVKRGG